MNLHLISGEAEADVSHTQIHCNLKYLAPASAADRRFPNDC